MQIDLSSRRRYLGIDDSFTADIKAVWPLLEKDMLGVLDTFYTHILQEPHLARFLQGKDISGLKHAQLQHWRSAFLDGFDESYEKRVIRIGMAHARIGLEPRWFLGAYCLIINEAARIIDLNAGWRNARRSRLKAALTKLVFMDMDATISVYDELSRQQNETARENALTDLVSSFNAQVAGLVEGVARSTEELAASMATVTQQAANVTSQAQRASGQAAQSGEITQQLARAAQEITQVVCLIREVAEQTNMLALNAAIEAARAGEAGRGFAVVADEVKKLAARTTKATGIITERITEVQTVSGRTMDMAAQIATFIDEITTASQTIATSIHQQGALTQTIGTGMTDVRTSIGTFFGRYLKHPEESTSSQTP